MTTATINVIMGDSELDELTVKTPEFVIMKGNEVVTRLTVFYCEEEGLLTIVHTPNLKKVEVTNF